MADKIEAIQTHFDMGSRTVEIKQNTIIFGVKVEQAEKDPDHRVQPINDLTGYVRVAIDQDTGTVNYGTMQNSFLFKALNHVVLKSIDQTEEIELNPNDYSKKLNGGNAPDATATSNYNTFARADKLYIYQYDQDGYEYYYISDKKVDDNYEPIGFFNSTGETASIYMGTFLGSYDNQSRLRSVSGVNIRNYTIFTEIYNAAQKNGKDYHMRTLSHNNLYEIAYLIMFQNDDSHTALGKGRVINGGSKSNQHSTQITGFANNKGAIAYNPDTNAVKFMHIEDFLFDNGNVYEEGIHFKSNTTFVKMKPPYSIKDINGDISSYTKVSGAATTNNTRSENVKTSIPNNKWGRIPSSVGGSSYIYQCDFWHTAGVVTNPTLTACVCGLGGVSSRISYTFTGATENVFARLSLIPEN